MPQHIDKYFVKNSGLLIFFQSTNTGVLAKVNLKMRLMLATHLFFHREIALGQNLPTTTSQQNEPNHSERSYKHRPYSNEQQKCLKDQPQPLIISCYTYLYSFRLMLIYEVLIKNNFNYNISFFFITRIYRLKKKKKKLERTIFQNFCYIKKM